MYGWRGVGGFLTHGDEPEDKVVTFGKAERIIEFAHGGDEGVCRWVSGFDHSDRL